MDLFLVIFIVLGLLLYAYKYSSTKVAEIGKIVFACAFLAICLRGGVHLSFR